MYAFTTDWFSGNIPTWDHFFNILRPKHVLEIGSWEGRSTIYCIEKIHNYHGEGSITCIDTWEGGIENEKSQMPSVESRFLANMAEASKRHPGVQIDVRKGLSVHKLAEQLAGNNYGFYDVAYVDGSHQAPDVLTDLILAHQLVRVGGMIICDDYLNTSRTGNPLMDTKIAIDAFTNIFYNKVGVMRAPLYQLFLHKVA